MEAVAVNDDQNNQESNKSKGVPFGIQGFVLQVKAVVFTYHLKSLLQFDPDNFSGTGTRISTLTQTLFRRIGQGGEVKPRDFCQPVTLAYSRL
jgi:hypothetical protein